MQQSRWQPEERFRHVGGSKADSLTRSPKRSVILSATCRSTSTIYFVTQQPCRRTLNIETHQHNCCVATMQVAAAARQPCCALCVTADAQKPLFMVWMHPQRRHPTAPASSTRLLAWSQCCAAASGCCVRLRVQAPTNDMNSRVPCMSALHLPLTFSRNWKVIFSVALCCSWCAAP